MKAKVAIAAVVLLTSTSAYADSKYAITDLGTLGGPISYAYAINANGDVVGESDTANGTRHAFLYHNGSMHDLGTLGGNNSAAFGINASGQIVGQADDAIGSQHAFLFANGSMTTLGPPNAYIAYAINNQGQAVGVLAQPEGLHAALFENGQAIDMDANSGRTFGTALTINNSGVPGGIGSYGDDSNSPVRAFIYINGAVTDPVAFVPYLTIINAINDHGVAVGQALGHAVLFPAKDTITDIGVLGSPPGAFMSEALSINNLGDVVGYQTGDTAFLYTGGTLFNLNSLIPESGWNLSRATSINDSGQIVGYGQLDGETHAFLLTPTIANALVPEPATLSLITLTIIPLLHRRRR